MGANNSKSSAVNHDKPNGVAPVTVRTDEESPRSQRSVSAAALPPQSSSPGPSAAASAVVTPRSNMAAPVSFGPSRTASPLPADPSSHLSPSSPAPGSRYFWRECTLHLPPQLRVLDLSNQGMTVREARGMVRALRDHHSVVELNLRDNRLGDEGVKVLSSYLKNDAALVRLDLARNSFGDPGLRHLARAIRSNARLVVTDLGLAGNDITDEGCHALFASLQCNSALATIDLASNSRISPHAMHMMQCSRTRPEVMAQQAVEDMFAAAEDADATTESPTTSDRRQVVGIVESPTRANCVTPSPQSPVQTQGHSFGNPFADVDTPSSAAASTAASPSTPASPAPSPRVRRKHAALQVHQLRIESALDTQVALFSSRPLDDVRSDLLADVRCSLLGTGGGDVESLARFVDVSGTFRSGGIAAPAFHAFMVERLGFEACARLVPRMIADLSANNVNATSTTTTTNTLRERAQALRQAHVEYASVRALHDDDAIGAAESRSRVASVMDLPSPSTTAARVAPISPDPHASAGADTDTFAPTDANRATRVRSTTTGSVRDSAITASPASSTHPQSAKLVAPVPRAQRPSLSTAPADIPSSAPAFSNLRSSLDDGVDKLPPDVHAEYRAVQAQVAAAAAAAAADAQRARDQEAERERYAAVARAAAEAEERRKREAAAVAAAAAAAEAEAESERIRAAKRASAEAAAAEADRKRRRRDEKAARREQERLEAERASAEAAEEAERVAAADREEREALEAKKRRKEEKRARRAAKEKEKEQRDTSTETASDEQKRRTSTAAEGANNNGTPPTAIPALPTSLFSTPPPAPTPADLLASVCDDASARAAVRAWTDRFTAQLPLISVPPVPPPMPEIGSAAAALRAAANGRFVPYEDEVKAARIEAATRLRLAPLHAAYAQAVSDAAKRDRAQAAMHADVVPLLINLHLIFPPPPSSPSSSAAVAPWPFSTVLSSSARTPTDVKKAFLKASVAAHPDKQVGREDTRVKISAALFPVLQASYQQFAKNTSK